MKSIFSSPSEGLKFRRWKNLTEETRDLSINGGFYKTQHPSDSCPNKKSGYGSGSHTETEDLGSTPGTSWTLALRLPSSLREMEGTLLNKRVFFI